MVEKQGLETLNIYPGFKGCFVNTKAPRGIEIEYLSGRLQNMAYLTHYGGFKIYPPILWYSALQTVKPNSPPLEYGLYQGLASHWGKAADIVWWHFSSLLEMSTWWEIETFYQQLQGTVWPFPTALWVSYQASRIKPGSSFCLKLLCLWSSMVEPFPLKLQQIVIGEKHPPFCSTKTQVELSSMKNLAVCHSGNRVDSEITDF